MSDLEIKHESGVATLTMNRPEARNALSLEMREELIEALHDVEHGIVIAKKNDILTSGML